MFNNIIIGTYYPIKSLIHNLNTINKIICTFIFLLMILITQNIWLLLALSIFTIILIIISNVPIRYYLNGINSFKLLILIIFIFDYLFTNNILVAVNSVLRIMLIVTYTSILMFTTKPNEITYGLERIFMPLKYFKIPIKALALSLSLALQFIPTIFEQANKILKSQASRGIDFKYANIKGKITALSTMLIPMFILSFKRADDLADAMIVRLYGYDKKRSNYHISRWTECDNTIVIVHMAILIIVIFSEVSL